MHFRNFLKKYVQNFRKISQNFQEIVFGAQTRKKVTHALLHFLINMLKYCIFRNFLKKTLENFRKFFEIFLNIFWKFFEIFFEKVFAQKKNPGYAHALW